MCPCLATDTSVGSEPYGIVTSAVVGDALAALPAGVQPIVQAIELRASQIIALHNTKPGKSSEEARIQESLAVLAGMFLPFPIPILRPRLVMVWQVTRHTFLLQI